METFSGSKQTFPVLFGLPVFRTLLIPRTRLLSEQVHDVGGEFVAALIVLLHLLLVDGPDLGQLGLVVRVFDGSVLQ